MAEIRIWAEEDVILPVSQKDNKIDPIDELWRVGYDLGEKPAAEEFNYLLNMITEWIANFETTGLPELDNHFLVQSKNLSDVPDKGVARTNLGVYSKTEGDARYVNINGSSQMTGNLKTTGITFNAEASDIARIDTTISAGTTYLNLTVGDDVNSDQIRFLFQTGSTYRTLLSSYVNGSNVATTNVSGYLLEEGSRVYSPRNPQPIPASGVMGVRLAGQGYVVVTGGRWNPTLVPAGAVAVGWGVEGSAPVDDFLYYRYLQVYLNGVWQTVANA